ncbi:XRE family transcriptional regulator [Candidatus Cryosericum septentrionale]|uniref:XRE family transcriptional regulator n=2 Tax=Candidatus Cryosericum septentrionale TaxID=2290913 RepID=A0A398DR64_9BACT|nr:XRE family transcriptional regulator [Candidatus Cryosericum septentrionale]
MFRVVRYCHNNVDALCCFYDILVYTTIALGGATMNKTFANAGPTLKNVREKGKLTQGNVAAYLEVDQSLISRFESGERTLSLGQIEQVATLLGVDISALASDTVEAKPLSIAFRSTDISVQDLRAIAVITKIALNSNTMTRMLKDSELHE